jgi:hypothetical protein
LDANIRGFLLVKQGFAIGKRIDIAMYFGKRTTYFDRFIGEIFVTHSNLIPNAARSGFEPSPLRTLFFDALKDIGSFYNNKADVYQECTLGDVILDETYELIRKIEPNLLPSYDKSEQLIDFLIEIDDFKKKLEKRIKKGSFFESRLKEAIELKNYLKTLEKQIKDIIDSHAKSEKTEISKNPENEAIKRAAKLPKRGYSISIKNKPTSLIEVVEFLGIGSSKDLNRLLEIIDEKFIQPLAKNKDDYYSKLGLLAEELEENILGDE